MFCLLFYSQQRSAGNNSLLRSGQAFQSRKIQQRVRIARIWPPAHFGRSCKAATHGRPARQAKDAAEVAIIKLRTTYTRWLALRHARDGRADGGRDATGTAAGSAVHGRYGLFKGWNESCIVAATPPLHAAAIETPQICHEMLHACNAVGMISRQHGAVSAHVPLGASLTSGIQ